MWLLLRQHVISISSYGGITHIRFKGRRSYLPLSLSPQAPLRFLVIGQPQVSLRLLREWIICRFPEEYKMSSQKKHVPECVHDTYISGTL